jgi:hypothetical protein
VDSPRSARSDTGRGGVPVRHELVVRDPLLLAGRPAQGRIVFSSGSSWLSAISLLTTFGGCFNPAQIDGVR